MFKNTFLDDESSYLDQVLRKIHGSDFLDEYDHTSTAEPNAQNVTEFVNQIPDDPHDLISTTPNSADANEQVEQDHSSTIESINYTTEKSITLYTTFEAIVQSNTGTTMKTTIDSPPITQLISKEFKIHYMLLFTFTPY